MTEIKLTKRYPHSRTEDITDAFMRGYEQGKKDGLKVGKQIVLGAFETYITADRKTEPNCSEFPNNSTISKMEQVETMSCAECKHRPIGAEICEEPCHYEPQTDWHYDEQDATWYPYKHEDEPQQKSCATCKHALGNWDGESNNCGRCCGADRRFYEPKDEPQTDCSWK